MADSSVDISRDDILVDYPNSFDRYVFYRGSDQQPVHTITWDDLVYPILSQKGKPSGIATLDSSGKVPLAQLPDIGTESYVFQYKVPGETPENFYTTNKTAIDAFAASVIKGGRPSCSLAYTALSVGVKVTIYYDVQILQNSNSANITFKAVSVYSNTDGVISWNNVSGGIQVGNINDIPNSTSIRSITPNLESVKIATTIDYTSLTEQAVPGEFWLDSDGVTKKQVYCRTFTGTFNFSTASNIVLANGIKSYEVVHSSILAGAGDSIIDNKVTDEGYISPGTNTSWTIQNRLESNICQLAIVGQALLNKNLRYVVTLKYIKI